MQAIKKVLWVLATAVLLTFIVFNWGRPVPVYFWADSDGKLLGFEWPVGFVALVFFLLGLVPMWLLHKGVRWRFTRRLNALERTVQAATATAPATIATTTQLEQAAHTQPD